MPSPTKQTLGSLLRTFRQGRGWTVKQMSAQSGVPFSTLSKVENDRLSLTYDKLQQISENLGVRMSELLSEQDTASAVANSRRSIATLDNALHVSTPQYEYFYMAPELREKDMIPLISRLKVKSLAEFGELVRHQGQEFIYVIKGKVEVHTEFYDVAILEMGESVYLDSQMGHAFVVGDGFDEATILSVCSTSQEELIRSANDLMDDN